MLRMLFWICMVVLLYLNVINGSNHANKIYYMGGYTAEICGQSSKFRVNGSNNNIENVFQCKRSNGSCIKHSYLCSLPCNFIPRFVAIDHKNIVVTSENYPEIVISPLKKGTVYTNNANLTLTTEGDLSLLLLSEIWIVFPNDSNVVCPILEKSKTSLICSLNLDNVTHYQQTNVSVTVRYGHKQCDNKISVGNIVVRRLSVSEMLLKKYYWIIITSVFVVILGVCMCGFSMKIKRTTLAAISSSLQNEEKLENIKCKYINTQKRAFLEYQTAVDSFSDLGSLTPRHTLGFYHFISRVFNVELPMDSPVYRKFDSDDFKEFLLNKDNLISWVEKMEKRCKVQQRSQVASLLTIVLFQHPAYFLEVMKCLLEKYIKSVKETNEERIVFRKSEAIVEKLIGNWITLCMYRNLKTGEIGKRFFNLYRAIKCKMNLGIVDCLTKKAKYAMTYDHIMLSDIDYDILNVKADVDITLSMMSNTCSPLSIVMNGFDVTVLSHDSVSQVKEKILDKAIMVYAEKEKIDDWRENSDISIALTDVRTLSLHFVNNTTQILLDDFDRTSMPSSIDKETIMVNTMKHYNMKSGTRFLLKSIVQAANIKILPTDERSRSISNNPKVHLQFPQNHIKTNTEYQKQPSNEVHLKLLFNLVFEDMNKEAYLMLIMATKQSILAFIDGFFQCVFNWNPSRTAGVSSNSLFETDDSQNLVTKESYLMPVYFLFSMFDDIARSLNITDELAILLWKSNSFILRFWVNLIKNPNFIFSVDKTGPIDGSLTTIASVLMESCSISLGSTVVDVNLPIVKQLFLKELKEYSSWWRSFAESATHIEDANMVLMMQDIIETYDMSNHFNSSLASLHAISNTLINEATDS